MFLSAGSSLSHDRYRHTALPFQWSKKPVYFLETSICVGINFASVNGNSKLLLWFGVLVQLLPCLFYSLFMCHVQLHAFVFFPHIFNCPVQFHPCQFSFAGVLMQPPGAPQSVTYPELGSCSFDASIFIRVMSECRSNMDARQNTLTAVSNI